MLARVSTAAVLAALLAASATAATSSRGTARQATETTQLLMPGVSWTRQVEFTPRGPVVLDVVTAPKPDGSLYSLAPVLSNEAILGAETLTGIEKRLSGAGTLVGIDGDYFDAATGAPSGLLVRGGVLDKAPLATRSAIGIAADGTLTAARVSYKGTWQGNGQRRSLDLNAAPVKGHATLYTQAYGPTTPDEAAVVEVVLGSFPPARPGQALAGTVGEVRTSGLTPIPPGGAVLVARGQQARALSAEAPMGQAVEVRQTLTPDWSGMQSALGGGPLLVRRGKPIFDARESFSAGTVNGRSARGAVAQLPDGRILLVTVEGGRPAYSVGMTSYELAVALARLGAVTAVGLGSGAPAGLAFDGTALSRASGGAERPVADALVLSYTGVYAAPPATDVVSPNGDGVDDTQTFTVKVVRPSQLTATLTGPGKAALVLAQASEQPGTYTFPWDATGAAEGDWTFAVSDGSTTAQRAFSVNDTLGSLALSGTNIAFQLSRPADVAVTVEKANGVTVATVLAAKLGAGAQQVTWNGTPRSGYRVRVVATNSIGTVAETAQFGSRRR